MLAGMKPVLLMILGQAASAGVSVLLKLATNDGMRPGVLLAYRFLFGSAFILFLALVLARDTIPKLTWMLLLQSFISGLLGSALAQILYVESLVLTSPTFISAISNLLPAITFVLALALGLERLTLDTVAGKAKVVGTMVGVGGAMVLTLYKGIEIHLWSTHLNLIHQTEAASQSSDPSGSSTSTSKQLLGALLALGSCLSYAFWLTIQPRLSQECPCHYWRSALMNLMALLQTTIFALATHCKQQGWRSQWKLGFNIRLLAAAYAGILGSGVMMSLITWCVHKRGPLFVSNFSPLGIVLVALASSVLLDEALHLGWILGAVLITCGLYSVLWGKSQEMKKSNQLEEEIETEILPQAPSIQLVIHQPRENDLIPSTSSSRKEGAADHTSNKTIDGRNNIQAQ